MRKVLIAVVSLALAFAGAWMLYNKFVLGGGSFRFYNITAVGLLVGGSLWHWVDILGPMFGFHLDDDELESDD